MESDIYDTITLVEVQLKMHPHKVDYSTFMSVACLWIYIHFGKWENAAYVVADSSDVDVKEDDYSNHNDRSVKSAPRRLRNRDRQDFLLSSKVKEEDSDSTGHS